MLREFKHKFMTLIFLGSLAFIFLSLSVTRSYAQKTYDPSKESQAPVTSIRCNTFTFDATGSFDPDNKKLSFFWDFGDGQTSTAPVIEHTYRKSGDYQVTLTVSDNSGLNCSTARQTQIVRVNMPPLAAFDTDTDQYCAGKAITFDAGKSSDENTKNLYYEWDFGDGKKVINQKRVTKTFQKGGTYKVSLTVNDGTNTPCSAQTVEKKIQVNKPPVADAGTDTILKCVNEQSDMIVSFDASNSRDTNNDNLKYLWDFGDGEKAQGIKVSHQYANIDNYQVKLIVKDDTNTSCGTNVDFVTVRLNKAPKADAGEDAAACPGEMITFNGSDSYVNKKGTVTAKWFFGDGNTAQGFNTEHAYDKPGQYHASLTLENELNSMCPASRDTRLVSVNSTPSVAIKSINSVCLGSKVNFDATSASDADGDDLEYYWSFGDGTILKGGQKATHEYNQGGNYLVTVIVDDNKATACSTATDEKYVKVNTPPVADAGVELACCVGMQSIFDASGSSDPDNDRLTYIWDFGDGTTANGMKVTHTYTKSGAFNVTLTVDDNAGSPCSKSTTGFTAQVNAKPVPIMNIR